MAVHLTDDIIARGSLTPPNPEEVQGTGEPDMVAMYLDDDEVYRWYHEDGTPTDAAAPTIQSAFATARVTWPNFELVEYRDQLIQSEGERRIADRSAADEKDELSRE